MTSFAIKALRIFSKVWFALVALLIVASIIMVWKQHGFGAVQEIMSPFNIANFVVVIVTLSPAIGAYMLADRLEQKRE